MKPLKDKILVEKIEEEQKTDSGVILTESAKDMFLRGKVIDLGEGRIREDGQRVPIVDIKVGDLVMFFRNSGAVLRLDGKDHILLSENEVLGVENG